MSDNLKEMQAAFEEWAGYSAEFNPSAWKAWQAAIASQQAAHDAEIAKLKEEVVKWTDISERSALVSTSAQQRAEKANAACAMKDEALKKSQVVLRGLTFKDAAITAALEMINSTLSISQQQVYEWERKQLEPLRAQVAMLNKAVRRVADWDKRNGNAHHSFCNFQPTDSVISHGGTFCNCGIVDCAIAAENTQATADQFIAECKFSAIEHYDLLDEYEKAKYRLELRATSKKAG